MDGSAFRHLPVGKIITMAIVGMVATAIVSTAAIIGGVWWLVTHVHIS